MSFDRRMYSICLGTPLLPNVILGNHCNRYLHSKIHKIDMFLRTIEARPILMSLIKEASLEWRDTTGELSYDLTMSKIMTILQPTLEFLHLALPHGKLHTKARTLVTSLAIGFFNLASFFDETVHECEIYDLFSLPKLDCLAIRGNTSWGECKTTRKQSLTRSDASNLTSLSFYGGIPPVQDLVEVLKWPKQLKSLHILLNCARIPESWGTGQLIDIPFELIRDIEPQLQNLEELFISSVGSIDSSTPVKLKSFPALKRVGVPQDFLINDERDHSRIVESLPPRLEELQIEMLNYFSWRSYIQKDAPLRHQGLSMWLFEVAQNKVTHYPSLKKVILWHDSDIPNSYNLHTDPDAEMFVSAFAEAEIELSLVSKYRDTLFAL